MAVGFGLDALVVVALGALWVTHAGIDCVLGYGLKSPEEFNAMHLGTLGK